MKTPLCCPVCYHDLVETNDTALTCPACNKTFPVHNGIPVLINEQNSVFSISELVSTHAATVAKPNTGLKFYLLKCLLFLQKAAPAITLNLKAKRNYKLFADSLLKKTENPKVLVVGGGKAFGEGLQGIIDLPITFIETDVFFGPNTKVVCDAHNLPFKDNYFDGVIMQAVLEYVVDPYQCVAEVHRVLKPDMLVYAETPFMQQVHGREFDFTRFTYLGHRRLFRHFEEIESGACVGTGTALAWSWKYFVLSFSDRKIIREFLLLFANWTAFVFKYFDLLTIHKKATLDAASGYYFMGRKSDLTLSDKELIKQYKGML